MGPNGRRLHGGIGIGRCRNGPKRPNYAISQAAATFRYFSEGKEAEKEEKRKEKRKKGKKEGRFLTRVSRPAGDLVGPGRWAPTTRAEDPRTLAYLVDTPEGR